MVQIYIKSSGENSLDRECPECGAYLSVDCDPGSKIIIKCPECGYSENMKVYSGLDK